MSGGSRGSAFWLCPGDALLKGTSSFLANQRCLSEPSWASASRSHEQHPHATEWPPRGLLAAPFLRIRLTVETAICVGAPWNEFPVDTEGSLYLYLYLKYMGYAKIFPMPSALNGVWIMLIFLIVRCAPCTNLSPTWRDTLLHTSFCSVSPLLPF